MIRLCAGVGTDLIHFALDPKTGSLDRLSSLRMPAPIQEASLSASLPILYVSCGDRGPKSNAGRGYICAVRAVRSRELRMHGEPVRLPARPIYTTTDIPDRHVLNAYDETVGLTSHRLDASGAVGEQIDLPESFDYGVFPHQIRVAASNDRAILVDRGESGLGGPAYVRGSLKVLEYKDGRVRNLASVDMSEYPAMATFNPRHLDFHPSLPLLYLTLEAQNMMTVLRLEQGLLAPEAELTRDLLADRANLKPPTRQGAGTVHVHPTGKHLYVSNRGTGPLGGPGWTTPWMTPSEPMMIEGGENSIAVFSLNETGVPTLLQHVDTRGVSPRTFTMDPEGRVLVVANSMPGIVKKGSTRTKVPASLAMFSVGSDGGLTFMEKYDMDVGRNTLWWVGIV